MSALEQEQKPPRITPQEYLERERRAETKSEYWDGEMVAMAGASLSHNRITRNMSAAFSARLRQSPCEPFASDMKVHVSRTKYFYPDVVVACAPIDLEDVHQDVLLNPRVIVEVLSPSTAKDDYALKFAFYRQAQTITDYVIVSQNEMLVEHYARQGSGQWLFTELRGLDAVLCLPSVGCEMPLAEVYARVEFAPDAAEEKS